MPAVLIAMEGSAAGAAADVAAGWACFGAFCDVCWRGFANAGAANRIARQTIPRRRMRFPPSLDECGKFYIKLRAAFVENIAGLFLRLEQHVRCSVRSIQTGSVQSCSPRV